MYVEIVGLETALRAVDAFGKRVEVAAAGAALDEAEFEFEITQERVPVGPTENLKHSGRVEKVEFAGTTVAASIAYGGPAGSGKGQNGDVDYALAVHEDLEAHHPNGQAKYVEAVIREEESSGRAAKRMSDSIVARLGLK